MYSSIGSIARTARSISRIAPRNISSKDIRIVEVGPRDGLQNESTFLDTTLKIQLIQDLAQTGLCTIETTSFVSPRWVPQMADSSLVYSAVKSLASHGVNLPCLVPNLKGMDTALSAGVKEIAVFAAASESFSRKNINCSIQESMDRFKPVVDLALEKNVLVRGYVSTIVGCPYEGRISPQTAASVAKRLYDMGCYEISLGDTIGVARPSELKAVIRACTELGIPASKLAAHCHNTYGQALSNIYAALEEGITVIDSSVAGLGGCPYAKGATGNSATEDLVYLLEGQGLDSGVDLERLVRVGHWISKQLNKPYNSNAGRALSLKMGLE